ncbi:bestrophin-4-like [Musca domestica]|uniref:Bestrophin homolog n=1 Tax=Musca domestica TaxID=7370 RepID=A0A1I8N924_MUSDO|nr:bestrophin-4-like [Musca domestica]
MTVSYAAEVAQCTGFGCFPKLLLRWRASIYKLIWLDLCIYLSIYYALNFTYRFYMNESQKQFFETIVVYCYSSISLIPIMFVLGFYVSVVVKRWWEQYMTLPWPDSTAVYVSSLIRGQDDNGRKMRRTIMRYVCLSLTMVLTRISPRVKKRFPTLDHLVDAGLLVENEKQILKSMNEKFAKHPKHWMPIVWASAIVTRARKEGRIRDDSSLKTLIDALNSFREKCMVLTFYDTMSIPLVYTQVVTLAVYTFFLASVFGRQWTGQTDPDGIMNIVDYFFPIFTVLEFMFFMGWLKVAESLICPFGEDDDDFELNWLIDRNLQVSYLIVDEMHNEHPELLKDQYWQSFYQKQTGDPPLHSTAKLGETESRNTLLSGNILDSLTNFFLKRGSKTNSQYDENVKELESTIKQYFDDDKFKIFHDSEERNTNLNLKTSSSECRASSPSINDSPDEFEQLKSKRAEERLQRKHLILTIPSVKISDTDRKSQISETINASSSHQSFQQSLDNSSENTGETKKNI